MSSRRVRKKQLRRALFKFIDACDKYEAARERIYRKAVEDFMDAQGKSREISNAALRRYMEVVSFLAYSGPPPKSLREKYNSVHPSPHS